MALRSFADGALFAETFGEGPPRVLALHGWGRRGADFRQSLVEIPALAPDFPGFGASPAPSEVIGARDYAEMITPLLEEYPEPPVVVGHSFGGRVAVCLAARHPDRVGPLLVTGAPLLRVGPGRRPRITFRLARWLNHAGLFPDDRMEELRRNRGSADYRATTGVMREILVKVISETYEEELAGLKKPMELLWGSRDTEVPLAVAHLAAAVARESGNEDVWVSVADDVGHHLPIEAPLLLAGEVKSLLDP